MSLYLLLHNPVIEYILIGIPFEIILFLVSYFFWRKNETDNSDEKINEQVLKNKHRIIGVFAIISLLFLAALYAYVDSKEENKSKSSFSNDLVTSPTSNVAPSNKPSPTEEPTESPSPTDKPSQTESHFPTDIPTDIPSKMSYEPTTRIEQINYELLDYGIKDEVIDGYQWKVWYADIKNTGTTYWDSSSTTPLILGVYFYIDGNGLGGRCLYNIGTIEPEESYHFSYGYDYKDRSGSYILTIKVEVYSPNMEVLDCIGEYSKDIAIE